MERAKDSNTKGEKGPSNNTRWTGRGGFIPHSRWFCVCRESCLELYKTNYLAWSFLDRYQYYQYQQISVRFVSFYLAWRNTVSCAAVEPEQYFGNENTVGSVLFSVNLELAIIYIYIENHRQLSATREQTYLPKIRQYTYTLVGHVLVGRPPWSSLS